MKKHIPNAITLLNLLSGLIALVYAFDDNIHMAFLWVCIGIFFDYWDGFVARILNVKSEMGLQLDSLADMVTSGVVPGLVVYKMLANIQENQEIYNLTPETYYMGVVPYLGFIITLGAAYRLAKFNIDTRQTDSFIGLPTPGNALFILSIPMIISTTKSEEIISLLSNPYLLVVISILSAIIMNAELPLFSLKIKPNNLGAYKLQIGFMLLSLVLLATLLYLAIPIIILVYILLSIIMNMTKKQTAN
ncbi:CDP-alcohol phosphatidyltransferase family protein [Myroides odoratimimus]|uniref:CDP-alcohol phosphatidyltransferase family protein n=1 Tax=Myroides odoratimimus TaxID=76832 RepID=UPI000245F92D|nr:CDP-alcohol phosphatidyltransferase family protein [Myroides odoratimimus]EHO06499.1 CDP-diacylglycerol-serine O-phosphatidyltransferase [Myroides odoratimimus CCUG 12901]EPH06643.1 CDP-diacylglycerol-serine O-phosphatidyltransferase [Myroides odoratimimus CCUG 12700]MCA4792915.1 CDP-alcohol phosphatidyltransferase family protein [Myroides odoratimimus]MCA4807656.1 CDP-alcohol phosphatidyltransferase family protein [Myroides odoratimimus]MCA4820214.1 CDP-alcohol phosphatidyltransferase fami